jgi:hypothetical protein
MEEILLEVEVHLEQEDAALLVQVERGQWE